jgi:hypothetical protein
MSGAFLTPSCTRTAFCRPPKRMSVRG